MKGLVLTLLGIVMVLAALAAYGTVQVRATHDERNRALPGDNLIAQPVGMANHIPGHRDHHSGHRDHRSDDHDQLIGIIPERVIGIIPES
jgi:hypothetical protein